MTTSTQADRSVSPWVNRSKFWVLNPGRHMQLCFDHGISDFVFPQKTYQFKRNLAFDPEKSLKLYGRGRPWRAILVERGGDVALLFDHRKGFKKPLAAYPIWSAKNDKFETLLELCDKYPEPGTDVGTFRYLYEEPSKVVEGQEQVILIQNPPSDRLEWQRVFTFVSDMKRVFPHITFHMFGGKSIARTIGISIDSFDHPVTLGWDPDGYPELLMPNGRYTRYPYVDCDHWGKLIGESLARFRRVTERREQAHIMYRFNLKSLIWATKNQDKIYTFNKPDPDGDVDYESSDDNWVPVLTKYRPRLREATDKWLCDTCTINHRCPYSRSGAICIVDGTEASKLSEKFTSRSASDIVDGLSTLLGTNTKRLEKALMAEEDAAMQTGQYRLSPQVTSLINATFDRGIQMARLLDPQVAGQMAGSRVQVGIVNANAGAVAQATPQQLMAGVAAQLDHYGIALKDATMDQVEAVMNGKAPVLKAIEVTSADDD